VFSAVHRCCRARQTDIPATSAGPHRGRWPRCRHLRHLV